MKYAITVAALCAVTALAGAANAKSTSGKKQMMSPSMEQCQGGYKKTYSKDMHWSKSKFKKACHKMMKSDMKMKDGMMKKDDMKKDGMMKNDGVKGKM